MYHIKRESLFGGRRLNEVNYGRIMNQHEVIINNIRDGFINMNKGTITKDNNNTFFVINTNKY